MYGYGGKPNYGVRLSDDDMNLALERTGSDYRVPQRQPEASEAPQSWRAPAAPRETQAQRVQPNTELVRTGGDQVISRPQGQFGGASDLLRNAQQNPAQSSSDSKRGTMNAGQGMDVMGIFTKIFGF